MKQVAFLLFLILGLSFSTPKSQAGIILMAGHGGESTSRKAKVLYGVSFVGVISAGVLIMSSGGSSPGTGLLVMLAGIGIILDDKVSDSSLKGIIAHTLPFIDDEYVLDELSKKINKQYNKDLSYQEIKIKEQTVRSLLSDAGYLPVEIKKAVKELSN